MLRVQSVLYSLSSVQNNGHEENGIAVAQERNAPSFNLRSNHFLVPRTHLVQCCNGVHDLVQ